MLRGAYRVWRTWRDVAPESETPVNPYSLLEAVNSSSDTAHTGWLIFLAIMTYLMIAVAGVTHEALLLETPVQLPILQVKIQLKQFFQFAPIVLVLFHLGILAQLVLLARKTLEFDHAIRLLETSDRRTHPLAARAAQLLLRAGDRRAAAQRRHERLPAHHVVADDRHPAGDPAALHAGRVPALPRRDDDVDQPHRARRSTSPCCC